MFQSSVETESITALKSGLAEPRCVLRRCSFVLEHSTAHWTDKEHKRLIPRRNQLIGKLLLYQRHIVNATDGRI